MKYDSGSRFAKFILDPGELQAATHANPYFLAYLQNKIADYASAAVEHQREPGQTAEEANLEHEKLKAQVQVLEELFREVNIPATADSQPEQSAQSNQE